MKRLVNRLFCLGVLLLALTASALAGPAPNGTAVLSLYDDAAAAYDAGADYTVVNIYLDGEKLEADIPGVLLGNTTMVPIRLVSESMGAAVNWSPQAPRAVEIVLEGRTILLTQYSNTAWVDGEEKSLPGEVTPVLMCNAVHTNSTMVPLRFVSETLGLKVEWDPDTYSVLLTSPVERGRVTAIAADAGSETVAIATDRQSQPILTDLGDRLVIDLPNFQLEGSVSAGLTLEEGQEGVASIRCANHDSSLYAQYEATARIVLDLREGVTVRENLRVDVTPAGILITCRPSQNTGGTEEPEAPAPNDPSAYTVVIDPGHGGSSSGAVYEGVYEKDLTLAVSLKVAALLEEMGYNVLMTRWDDSAVSLDERSDFANAADGDIFVSIHANALSDSTFQGLMTFHHPNSTIGPILARYIQEAVLASTGAIDRGVRSENYAVLRQTTMPAVLIEMGFMSSHEELTLLLDEGYQTRLAQGIAQGIDAYFASVGSAASSLEADDTPGDSVELEEPLDDES